MGEMGVLGDRAPRSSAGRPPNLSNQGLPSPRPRKRCVDSAMPEPHT